MGPTTEDYVSLEKSYLKPTLAMACNTLAGMIGYAPWASAIRRAGELPIGQMADAIGPVWVAMRDARHPLAGALDRLLVACCKADLDPPPYRARAIPLVAEALAMAEQTRMETT